MPAPPPPVFTPRLAATATVLASFVLRVALGRLRLFPGFLPLRWCRRAAVVLLSIAVLLLRDAGAALKAAGSDEGFSIIPSGLATTGLYAASRNPYYDVLSLLIVPSIAVALNSLWPLVLLPFLLAHLSLVVVPYEEALLDETFGKEYATYCTRVPRWYVQSWLSQMDIGTN